MGVRDHARQGGSGEVAEEIIIIHADDRHGFRHRQAAPSAGVEHLASAKIVTSHDPNRLGKLGEPCADLLDIELLIGHMRTLRREHRACAPRLRQRLLKMLLPPIRPIEPIVPAESKLLETTFQQVLGCEPGNGSVIGLEPRQIGDQPRRTHVHDRHLELPDRARDSCVLDSRDHPFTPPIRQPGRWHISTTVLGEMNGPRPILAHVGHHAMEKSTRVGIRRFDQ